MKKFVFGLGLFVGAYAIMSLFVLPPKAQYQSVRLAYNVAKLGDVNNVPLIIAEIEKSIAEGEARTAPYRNAKNVEKLAALIERVKTVKSESEAVSKLASPIKDALAQSRERVVAADKLLGSLEKDANGELSKQVDDLQAKAATFKQRMEALAVKQAKLEGLKTSFDEFDNQLKPMTDKDNGTLALLKQVKGLSSISGEAIGKIEAGDRNYGGNLSEQIAALEKSLTDQKKHVVSLQQLGERLQTLAVQYSLPPKQSATVGSIAGK